MLANSARRRRYRLLTRSSRLASPAQLVSKILEATGRLRQGRVHPGKKVAGEIQRAWPAEMARPDLWKRGPRRLLFRARTGLLRSLGDRTLPVSLSILEFPLVPYPRTRVVPWNRLPRPHFPPNHQLERLNHPRSPAVSWASNINLPSIDEYSPSQNGCQAHIRTHQVTRCYLPLATSTTARPSQRKTMGRADPPELALD